MIKTKLYSLNNLTLSNNLLNIYINKFWEDVFISINNSESPKHLLIMCKVLFKDQSMGYKTLGHLLKVNFDDKDLFINYLQERLGLASDGYITHPIDSIQFSYIVSEGKALDNDTRVLFKDLSDKKVKLHLFHSKKLPISMNPGDY